MLWRFALFYTLVLAVLLGIAWWVHRRTVEALGLGACARRRLAAFLMGVLLVSVAGRVLGRWFGAESSSLLRSLVLLGSAFTTGLLIAAGLLLPWDLGRLAFRGGRWLLRRSGRGPSLDPPRPGTKPRMPESERVLAGEALPVGRPGPKEAGGSRAEGVVWSSPEAGESGPLGRRIFLARAVQGSAVAAGMGLGLWGTAFGRLDFRVETLVVPLPGLPRGLDGYTLLQLSDVHVGTFVAEPELRAALDVVSRVRPDLVVLTGDLVDHDAAFAPLLGRFVRRLTEVARDGVVAVPGNHDYYAGIEDVAVALRGAGARVLLDDAWLLGRPGRGLVLLGVDDLWSAQWRRGRGPDLDRALARVPAAMDMPRVLLAHNPAFFPQAAGRVHLQLSGHTHGGQINVGSRLPAELVLPYGYVAGRYERSGSLLYVNRGLGTAGPPARVGSAPELTRVVFVSG